MSMQKGWRPALLLNKKGQILGLATGSDATSEHEGGCAPLMTALCGQAPWPATAAAAALKAGRLKEIPDVLAYRKIVQNLENILWIEGSVTVRDLAGVQTVPTGMIAFSTHKGAAESLAKNGQVSLPNFSAPTDISAAWDCDGFAFRVMGEKLVAKLKRFHQALRDGNCMFAGLFLDDEDSVLSGVILCDESLLRPEHRVKMREAQAEFENKVQLHCESRVDELIAAHPARGWFGHVSAMRYEPLPDGTRTVGYWLNPDFGVKAKTGVYSFEALLPWIAAGPHSGQTLAAPS